MNLLEVSCHKRQAWKHDVIEAITTQHRVLLVAKFRNIGGDDADAIMKQLHGPISLLGLGPEK